jgi:regulatory protein
MAEDPAVLIRRAALDLLARREHSKKELREKLARRFDDPELLDQQLDVLVEQNLQSDERFTESFVRFRSKKGQGPLRIVQELKQRGIAPDLQQLYVWEGEIDWQAVIAAVYLKKFGETGFVDCKDRAKKVRFLQYRGFDHDLIRHLNI